MPELDTAFFRTIPHVYSGLHGSRARLAVALPSCIWPPVAERRCSYNAIGIWLSSPRFPNPNPVAPPPLPALGQ